MNGIKKSEIFVIIIISVVIVLPFINEAYHIDDWVYLRAAIEYNNLGFNSINGTSTQDGLVFPNYYITHPLLYPLFLSFIIKIFHSASEYLLHLISIISLAIIGISSLIISKKFSKEYLLITIFLLLLPAVMVMSHVIMTDIPTVAFFLLALALHIEGVEKKSFWLYIFSGIAATIAVGISYQALFIVFLFVLYNIQKKEKRFIAYLSILIPLAIFVIWCIYTWAKFGIPHPFIAFIWAGDNDKRNILDMFSKFMGNINSLGAATIFPVFILITYLLKSQFRKLLIISFVLSVISMPVLVSNYFLVQKILFVIYASSGFFIILRIIILLKDSIAKKNKDYIFISTWFITFFIAIALLMPLGVSRYLLPCFLPVVIVIINDLKTLYFSKFKIIVYAGLVLTLIWSSLCSVADYKFAGVYRQFAKEFNSKYSDKTVWFTGEGGFKWYMEKERAKYLLKNNKKVQLGDIIVIPEQLWPISLSSLMKKSVHLDNVVYSSALPIRTLNLASHAGFYTEAHALLPFSITHCPYEIFSIYEVK